MSKKKEFKTTRIAVPETTGASTKRNAQTVGPENFKITSILVQPSTIKRFRIMCRELDLKVQDEFDMMLKEWIKKHENQ